MTAIETNRSSVISCRQGFNSLDQGSSNLALEGQYAAEFSSNSPICDFLMILKTLTGVPRCVWLVLEPNSAGKWISWDRFEDPCPRLYDNKFDWFEVFKYEVFRSEIKQLLFQNEDASWCRRRTLLSKGFHKEPLTPEEPFCFTKGYLW